MRKSLLFIFLAVSNIVISQDSIQSVKLKFGLTFSYNLFSYNFADLNDNLNSLSLSKISNPLEYFSVGFSIRDNSLSSYLQFKYGYLNKTFNSNAPEYTFLKSCYLDISYNYNVLNSYKTIIYPKISLGYMKTILGVYSATTNSQSFLTNLQNPNIVLFRSKGSLYADFGVGFEQRTKIFMSDLFLGLNTSYQFPFNKLIFYDISGNQVLDSPKSKFNGFKIEVTGRIELYWEKIISKSKLK